MTPSFVPTQRQSTSLAAQTSPASPKPLISSSSQVIFQRIRKSANHRTCRGVLLHGLEKYPAVWDIVANSLPVEVVLDKV